MYMLHMQCKLCTPIHNIQKRANKMKRNKACTEVNWHALAARRRPVPSPQAQIGLQTVTTMHRWLLLMLSLLLVSQLLLSLLLRLLVLLLSVMLLM